MPTSIRAEVSMQMGMVSCLVNVTAAVGEDKETSFNQVCVGPDDTHQHAPSGVKQGYTCPKCQNDDKTTFRKGRVDKSGAQVFTNEQIAELTAVPDDVTKTINLTVHRRQDVVGADMVPAGAPYYLEPATSAMQSSYATFVAGLEANPEIIMLAEWAPRSKTGLFEVQVRDGGLMFQRLAWPEMVRPAPKADAQPSERAIAQMGVLLDMSVSDFDVENYRDQRRAKIAALVAGTEVVEGAEGVSVPTKSTSIEDQLAAAVAAAQASKAKSSTTEGKAKATTTEGKAPAKKAAAKRTPAKAR